MLSRFIWSEISRAGQSAAALSLGSLACGGDTVNPTFAKSWVGQGTMTFMGAGPSVYPAELTIMVSGDTATVTNICPGAAPLPATGDGNTVKWTGSEACEPMGGGVCDPPGFIGPRVA